jgi:hypothetical protein
LRLLFEKDDCSLHLRHELVPQARALCLVPPTGLPQILFGAGADENGPFQAPVCLRMRASTSCQGEPGPGARV